MKSRFLESAETEFEEAVDHYREIATDLGDRFAADVRRAVTLIEQFPEASPVITQAVRKRVMFEFPYILFYRIGSDEVVILAVAHQRRRPMKWQQMGSRNDAG